MIVMSNRSLLEFNHDHAPARTDDELLRWGRQIRNYLGNGDPQELPPGVTFRHMRHHSEPDPMAGYSGTPRAPRPLPETISAADAAAMCPHCHALPAEPCKGQQAGVAAEYRQWGRLRLLARRAPACPRGSSG